MHLDPELPVPPPGPRMDFWSPVNKEPEPYVVLSNRIWKHHVHWIGYTAECTLRLDDAGLVLQDCEICSPETPRRPRGYLNVVHTHTAVPGFLVIPHGTLYALESSYGVDFIYRGLTIRVYRVGGHKNKPLVVTLDQYIPRKAEILPERDPSPYLDTVFRRRKKKA